MAHWRTLDGFPNWLNTIKHEASDKALGSRGRGGRIHQWTLAACWVRGVVGTGRGVGRGHANGWEMEVCGHASALCESGADGTGRDHKVQGWEVIPIASRLSGR